MAATQAEVHGARPDDVLRIEHLIQQGESRLAEARTALRHFLLAQTGEPEAEGSIGDALAALVRQPLKSSLAAIVFLRCPAVKGLVPDPNRTNQITRLTVELCETALSEIVTFLKVDKRAQNYAKFAVILGCHKQIAQIIDPLRQTYGDLDALLSARKEIIGSLRA